MRKLILLISVVVLVITGCGTAKKQEKPLAMVPVKVSIQLPNEIKTGQSVKLEALVTQGNEKVNDAEDVEFEIWKDGLKDKSEKIPAKGKGNGIYFVEKTFTQSGTYFVTSHVTARYMHVMPTKKFIVVK